MYLISACLCGVDCKYNGKNNFNEKVYKLLEEKKAILVCPEQLGGLSTPRISAEIKGGSAKDVLEGRAKVLNKEGDDVTEQFINGAYETLKIAKASGCTHAILKSKSPSCGFENVYDGTFAGNLIKGNGVTAELLKQNGIKIVTEDKL